MFCDMEDMNERALSTWRSQEAGLADILDDIELTALQAEATRAGEPVRGDESEELENDSFDGGWVTSNPARRTIIVPTHIVPFADFATDVRKTLNEVCVIRSHTCMMQGTGQR